MRVILMQDSAGDVPPVKIMFDHVQFLVFDGGRITFRAGTLWNVIIINVTAKPSETYDYKGSKYCTLTLLK